MKSKRHIRILEIINQKDIVTQEELAEELKNSGFEITQATVSRDIKNLKLIKTRNYRGEYRYEAPKSDYLEASDKVNAVMINLRVSVEIIDKMVVVKTLSAGAPPVAEAIDSLGFENIAGTIAGENTVFIAVRSLKSAEELVKAIKKLI